jgi:hypothetical protein
MTACATCVPQGCTGTPHGPRSATRQPQLDCIADEEWQPPPTNPRPYGFWLGEIPLDPGLHLSVETSQMQMCLVPLDASLDAVGHTLTVTIRGVEHVSECLGAAGPARRRFPLGELSGSYQLAFVEGGQRDEYAFEVSETDLRVTSTSTSFTMPVAAQRLVRVPPRVLEQMLRVECADRSNARCSGAIHPTCADVLADPSLQTPFVIEEASYTLENFFTRRCSVLSDDAPATASRYFVTSVDPRALIDRYPDLTPPPEGPCLLLRASTPALIKAMSW